MNSTVRNTNNNAPKVKEPSVSIFAAVHETAQDLHEIGLMSKKTLHNFDATCLIEGHHQDADAGLDLYRNGESRMITAQVQIQLPKPLTVEQAQEIFASTAPNYQGVDGLVRKYYLLSEGGDSAGGIYLWESREQAEKMYTPEWEQHILNKYGVTPTVTYFDTPVVVDNALGEITAEA